MLWNVNKCRHVTAHTMCKLFILMINMCRFNYLLNFGIFDHIAFTATWGRRDFTLVNGVCGRSKTLKLVRLKLLCEINEVHPVSSRQSFSLAFDLVLGDCSVSRYGNICMHFSLRAVSRSSIWRGSRSLTSQSFLSTGSQSNDRLPLYHYLIATLPVPPCIIL